MWKRINKPVKNKNCLFKIYINIANYLLQNNNNKNILRKGNITSSGN